MRDIVAYANALAGAAGHALSFRRHIRMVDVALRDREMTPEQRVMLAVACDLYDILCATPEGRDALRDLGFDPLLQDTKGE